MKKILAALITALLLTSAPALGDYQEAKDLVTKAKSVGNSLVVKVPAFKADMLLMSELRAAFKELYPNYKFKEAKGEFEGEFFIVKIRFWKPTQK